MQQPDDGLLFFQLTGHPTAIPADAPAYLVYDRAGLERPYTLCYHLTEAEADLAQLVRQGLAVCEVKPGVLGRPPLTLVR